MHRTLITLSLIGLSTMCGHRRPGTIIGSARRQRRLDHHHELRGHAAGCARSQGDHFDAGRPRPRKPSSRSRSAAPATRASTASSATATAPGTPAPTRVRPTSSWRSTALATSASCARTARAHTDGPDGAPKRALSRARIMVARAAVGIEPRLARALDGAGIGDRPVFDLGRRAAGEFQRL